MAPGLRADQEAVLAKVQAAQQEYWDALRELENTEGFSETTTEGIEDWGGYDVDTLLALEESDEKEEQTELSIAEREAALQRAEMATIPDEEDEEDVCTACGRESLDCSLNPCPEVIKDRGED